MARGELAVGDDHLCAISPEKHLECWGGNRHGQIRPDVSALGFAEPQVLRRDATDVRIELHSGLTCVLDRQ
ncbi:MAG TPA: RCC1 domain-containing protein, partial [Polyangiaceae bacterium]|nr:RCC1 domain-containing protein [Polyangiaceae bacterium]